MASDGLKAIPGGKVFTPRPDARAVVLSASCHAIARGTERCRMFGDRLTWEPGYKEICIGPYQFLFTDDDWGKWKPYVHKGSLAKEPFWAHYYGHWWWWSLYWRNWEFQILRVWTGAKWEQELLGIEVVKIKERQKA